MSTICPSSVGVPAVQNVSVVVVDPAVQNLSVAGVDPALRARGLTAKTIRHDEIL